MVVGASVITIGGAGLAAGTASAHGGHGSWWNQWNWNGYVSQSDDKFDTKLSSELATKFNLDEAEVAALVEQVRDNQFNVLDENRQEKLQEALTEGNLTQEQYDHIVAQLTKIDGLIDQVDDANWSERKELWNQIKAEFKELRAWMREEDISWRVIGFDKRWLHNSDWQHSHHDDRR